MASSAREKGGSRWVEERCRDGVQVYSFGEMLAKLVACEKRSFQRRSDVGFFGLLGCRLAQECSG